MPDCFIGQSRYGEVVLGINRKTKEKVAIKSIVFNKFEDEEAKMIKINELKAI